MKLLSKYLIGIIFLFLLAAGGCAQEVAEEYDIVVYGGTFAGCAAARTAAQLAPESSVLVIVPVPERVLGGAGTAGGQNFFDVRLWRGEVVTAGSFARWYREAGQFYNTRKMADLLSSDLARHKNITILWGYDVREVQRKLADDGGIKPLPGLSGIKRLAGLSKKGAGPFRENGLPPQNRLLLKTGAALEKSSLPFRLTALRLREVLRDGEEGAVIWGEGRRKIKGRVFIDASDDGRLTRLAGGNVTVGRGDWPDVFLPPGERGEEGPARQQAATLMFKVTGVVVPDAPQKIGDLEFLKDPSGSWGIVGGGDTFRRNPVVTGFNDRYAPRGFALKPLNAAQDGAGSDQWWVNALLVFNVDGRACRRDLGSERYPRSIREAALDVDEARSRARELLARPEFIQALRQFSAADERGGRYGFHRAELVKNGGGRPAVGDVLYLRETVHLRSEAAGSSPGFNGGAEKSSYALTPEECRLAGAGPADGADRENYPTRIGLAYYLLDINAYAPADLKQQGAYRWPVTDGSRPDLPAGGGQPKNPVYLPFEMLVSGQLVNLLAPGYATGAASFAWAEVRVIPNLCVLGDAAGAAAAGAVLSGEDPARFGQREIKWVQGALRKIGARLDK
ncbi:MAG: FAD-dependent oxidoreductase [Bacillota bacterium]